VALRLIYQMLTKLLGRLVLRARSDTSKEIEILVLRHQLAGPHQSLGQHPPAGSTPTPSSTTIQPLRQDRLGGLLHEYVHVA
jgi:hypothetical protein